MNSIRKLNKKTLSQKQLKIQKVADKLKNLRFSKRVDLLEDKHLREFTEYSLDGSVSPGKNENGQIVVSRSIEDLGVVIKTPKKVKISFKKSKFEKDVNSILRRTGASFYSLSTTTDIFRAVRLLNHIIENSENEFKSNDKVLDLIEKANSILVVSQTKLNKRDLKKVIGLLEEVKILLKRKTNHLKKFASSPMYCIGYDEDMSQQQKKNRKIVAEFMGASPDQIVLTTNTTEGLFLVINGLDFNKGDEVITTPITWIATAAAAAIFHGSSEVMPGNGRR